MNAVRFVIDALPEMTLLFIGVSFLVGVLNEFIPEERFSNRFVRGACARVPGWRCHGSVDSILQLLDGSDRYWPPQG